MLPVSYDAGSSFLYNSTLLSDTKIEPLINNKQREGKYMNLEKSRTLQNLINAFAGESQAVMRYTFFAKEAKKEGFEKISAVFMETAENEKEHAKLFYKHIPELETAPVNGEYPFILGDTKTNLKSSVQAECKECEVIYKQAGLIAKEEGFDEISRLFMNIVEIEKRHAHRFDVLSDSLNKGTLFVKEEQTQWICRKCGNCLISKQAPQICPVCGHPQGYYEIFTEKF